MNVVYSLQSAILLYCFVYYHRAWRYLLNAIKNKNPNRTSTQCAWSHKTNRQNRHKSQFFMIIVSQLLCEALHNATSKHELELPRFSINHVKQLLYLRLFEHFPKRTKRTKLSRIKCIKLQFLNGKLCVANNKYKNNT